MNVLTTSWHYQLISYWFARGDIPQNLCGYMRKLMIAIGIVMFLVAATVGMTALTLKSVGGAVLHFIDKHIYDLSWWAPPSGHLPAHIIAGYGIIVIGTVLYAWYATESARRRLYDRLARLTMRHGTPSYSEPRQLSVVGQWLKDRHDKICRQIEIITPDDLEAQDRGEEYPHLQARIDDDVPQNDDPQDRTIP